MRSSGPGPAGSLLCEDPQNRAPAGHKTSKITAGRKRRLGIRCTLSLSVEDIWVGVFDSLAIAWREAKIAGSRGHEALNRTILAHQVKALEKLIFGPRTLARTWGTRPEMLGRQIRCGAGLEIHRVLGSGEGGGARTRFAGQIYHQAFQDQALIRGRRT
jgi:hypothetical protein